MNPLLLLIAMSDVKTASDNREYYSATFQDKSNPFAKPAVRMYWSASNDDKSGAVWTSAKPEVIRPLVNKFTIEGSIVCKTVEPYTIGDKTVNTYTTAVFASEDLASVFKSAGHPLASVVAPAIVAPELELVD